MSTYSERKEQYIESLRTKLMNKTEEIIRNAYNLGEKTRERELEIPFQARLERLEMKHLEDNTRTRRAAYITGFRAGMRAVIDFGENEAVKELHRLTDDFIGLYGKEAE